MFSGTAKSVKTGEVRNFKNAHVYERNFGVRFIELSGVGDPACKSCRIQGVYNNESLDKAASCSHSGSLGGGHGFIAKVAAEAGETRCRLSVHASGDLNNFGLNGLLTQWEIQGWVPDVVIIDYADLLGRIPGIESRHESLEESWRQLRAISQRWHLCLVTATQSNRDGYNKELLDMDNFNGTRTQNDNVTAIYSINQTEKEAALGIQRIQAIANRDNPDKRVVACLGSRSVACPMMFSMFCEEEPEKKEKKAKPKVLAS
jgi:hypothetical protein